MVSLGHSSAPLDHGHPPWLTMNRTPLCYKSGQFTCSRHEADFRLTIFLQSFKKGRAMRKFFNEGSHQRAVRFLMAFCVLEGIGPPTLANTTSNEQSRSFLRRGFFSMSWTYYQSTGRLEFGGQLVAKGYSGASGHKDDPASEDKANLGPIPRGGRFNLQVHHSGHPA